MSERYPYCKPDGWLVGEELFVVGLPKPFGVRIKTGHMYGITDLAIVLEKTGKRDLSGYDGRKLYRCKITIPGDDAPDTIMGGIANDKAFELF